MSNYIRDYRFDNMKGILIILVVLGHAIERYQGYMLPIPGTIFSIIYSFHMAAFVFTSGYFSKNALKTEKYSEKQVKTVLVPFLISQLLMWVLSSHSISELFYPQWTLWYLLSLFIWKMLVNPLSKLRYSIAIAIVAALCIGFSPADRLLSVSRTVTFLPIFLMGYKTTDSDINKIRKVNKIVTVVFFAFIILIVIVMKNNGLPANMFFTMADPYESYEGLTEIQGMLFRIVALLIGFLSTCSLLILSPQKQSILSNLGRYTITIYLGHSYFIQAVGKIISHYSPSFFSNSLNVMLLSIVSVIIVCILFGNRRTAEIYEKALNWVSSIVLIKNESSN